MAWLLRDGEVLASAEVARSRRARARGLLGRDSIEGAIVIQPCRSVHTIGMRFPVDVAFCDEDMTVVRVVRMPRYRVGLPVWRARVVVEAEAGAFARWNLRPGDRLEVKGADDTVDPGGGAGPTDSGDPGGRDGSGESGDSGDQGGRRGSGGSGDSGDPGGRDSSGGRTGSGGRGGSGGAGGAGERGGSGGSGGGR